MTLVLIGKKWAGGRSAAGDGAAGGGGVGAPAAHGGDPIAGGVTFSAGHHGTEGSHTACIPFGCWACWSLRVYRGDIVCHGYTFVSIAATFLQKIENVTDIYLLFSKISCF